jgi:plastocyanin
MVRRGAFSLTTLLLLAVAACGGDDPMEPSDGGGGGGGGGGGTPVATTSVTLTTSLSFDPADIVVSPGATVTWTWANSTQHNVTFSNASITSSGNQSGGTFSSVMPTAAGTYNYSCTIHAGMNGSVQVQ